MEKNFMVDAIINAVSVRKQKEYASKPIRTLGEIILLLELQPSKNIVKLDFCDDNPTALISYRGYYEDLCLDYDSESSPVKVGELKQWFESAIGKTFTGYKGGDFTMHTKTLVWVAPYSRCGRMLTDIKQDGKSTIICTAEDK